MTAKTQVFSEKSLERWICMHPHLFAYQAHGGATYRLCERIIGRQVRLRSGIADLIVTANFGVNVVELKRGAIDHKAIIQIMRYIHDLRDLLHTAAYIANNDGLLDSQMYFETLNYFKIGGILVGERLADNSIPETCEAINTTCVLYEVVGNGVVRFEACIGHKRDFSRRGQDDFDRNAHLFGVLYQHLLDSFSDGPSQGPDFWKVTP